MKEIILTNTGKLGDFLYCLPIASWLARTRDAKIHWVLPGSFNPFNFLTPLLMLQPFTSRVSIVPFRVENYDCGGQPYRFDPRPYLHEFGCPDVNNSEGYTCNAQVSGEYYNLGFRGYPNKYISAFYAEEHGFDYDRDFRINLGDPLPKTEEILRSTEGAMAKLVPYATPMGTHEDLLTLARRMAAAKECHTWFCGLAILAAMSGIKVTVHRVPGHAYIPLYYEGDYSHVRFIEHQESEVK